MENKNRANLTELKNKVLSGELLTREELLTLVDADLTELKEGAREIKEKFLTNTFQLCSIINTKSGACSEDCKFCAQSSRYSTGAKIYPLMSAETIKELALSFEKTGITKLSLVTSGRRISKAEVEKMCEITRVLKKETRLVVCVSNGLLDYEDFVRLREAGVTYCHNNLETSRRHFSDLCTTHTYDDKIKTIKSAQKAGLISCTGGIFGIGETWEDRIDMGLQLRELEVKSVPMNFLSPIKGTPFENAEAVSEEDKERICALYRFLLPDAILRFACGRRDMKDYGREIFRTSVNACISGDMLTTCGPSTATDLSIVSSLGYEPEKLQ